MERGSEMFGTDVMKTDECALMALAMKENGSDNETILADIEFIDDLLSIQRMRVIGRAVAFTKSGRMRKDVTLQSMVDNRLNLYLQEHANS